MHSYGMRQKSFAMIVSVTRSLLISLLDGLLLSNISKKDLAFLYVKVKSAVNDDVAMIRYH